MSCITLRQAWNHESRQVPVKYHYLYTSRRILPRSFITLQRPPSIFSPLSQLPLRQSKSPVSVWREELRRPSSFRPRTFHCTVRTDIAPLVWMVGILKVKLRIAPYAPAQILILGKFEDLHLSRRSPLPWSGGAVALSSRYDETQFPQVLGKATGRIARPLQEVGKEEARSHKPRPYPSKTP
jgi:hypothetical protein